jgi:ADP-heptose:LPS heptosyltransferase
MLYYNKTKCPQILDVETFAIPTTIYPGMVFEANNYKITNWKPFELFTPEILQKADTITFLRAFALGDLIQLVAAMRLFRQRYKTKKIFVMTSERFVRPLNFLFKDFIFIEKEEVIWADNRFGLIVNLDSTLERDHSVQNEENHLHRVDIFLKNFGIEREENEILDWRLNPIKEIGVPDMVNGQKLIGLQIRGSGKMKTLPYDFIKRIANKIAEKYKVVLIDYERDKGFEGKNILNLCGKFSVQQCIFMMTKLDCCITMDSGVLWMAHVANCPVVTILGPTREAERVSLHPQYPQKAKSIDLSDMIGCASCFETMVRCQGSINCMNKFDRDLLESKILEKIEEILGA